MSRVAKLIYGLLGYAIFLMTFLYAIGFSGNLIVPKAIDDGETAGLIESIGVDVCLLALFAVQHSVMARAAFKRW